MTLFHRCYWCHKGVDYAQHIRHQKGVAGGRWKRKAQKRKRLQLPNLHLARVMVDSRGKVIAKESKNIGDVRKVMLCTKCLRRAKKKVRQKQVEEKKK